MVKIALDAGHGTNTPGKRTPDDEREWSFNNKVLLAAAARLNMYENVQILRLDDSTGKTDIPLATRTTKANNWKADVLVSIHHNALTGKWGSHGGVETFTQTGSSKASVDIAKIVQPRIVKAMGLRDRGHKISNLHMTRESKMPAILTEGGFMDSTTDITAMRNDTKLKAQGEAIADGLAVYFKLKLKTVAPKPNPAPTEMYRVRKSWSDVKSQIGAYTVLQSAKDLADKNKGYSVFNNAGSIVYTPKVEAPKPTPVPIPPVVKNPIMGKSQSTVEQMIAFVEKNNTNAKNLREIAYSFLEVGEKYGIRGDVAYCQSIIETEWFKFEKTSVTPDQHNYCGLGVTSLGMKGNSFKTVKDGVTAQIQHLMAYANKNTLPVGEVLLDPRFNLVTRGIAPNWEDLSMRWAMNANYGNHILSMYANLLKQPMPKIDLDEIFKWGRNNIYAQNIMIELWKKGGN